MKYLFIIILFTPLFMQAQWTARSGSNKFDGKYKAAIGTGKGGEFPYKNPMLVINRFESREPNIYLTGVGYTGCSSNSFKIAFDNDEEIYEINHTSTDADKEAVFLNFNYKSMQDLTIYELIDLLKSKRTLYLRHINSCGDNDYTFTLVGSTRAIEFVIEKGYYDEVKESDIKQKKEEEERYKIVQEVREEMIIKDSIAKVNDGIAKVKNTLRLAEMEKVELEQFSNTLKSSFQNADLIEILKFKTEGTIGVDICFKVYDSGLVSPKIKNYLFQSEDYIIYNKIIDDCLMISKFSQSGKVISTFYMRMEELGKATRVPKFLILKEKWDELLELSKE